MSFRVALAATLALMAAAAPLAAAGEPPPPTLTLTQAIALGRQRAPLLRAARAREAAAEATVRERAASYYPVLNASVTAAGNAQRDTQPAPPPQSGRFTFVDTSTAGSAAASLRWTLYDFGRTAHAVDAAEASLGAAAASAATADFDVAGEVARAFVTLHHREQIREVAAAILAHREQLAVLARELVKRGLQPPLEELRADARADAARVPVAGAEAAAEDARAALASLLALEPEARFQVVPPRLATLAIDTSGATLAAEGLPAVTAAAAERDSRRAAADATAARYLPTLSLSGDSAYTYTKHDRVDFAITTNRAAAGLLVSIPLFDLGIRAAVDRARAEANAAAAATEQVRRAARSEAARAMLAERGAAVALDHARRAAEGAGAVQAVVEARYARGLSSPIELIDAESAAADSRLAHAELELAHDLAVVRAFTAVGRPIVEAPPP